MMGFVLQICPVPFHIKRYLHLFDPQVERRYLRFVCVCTQIVGSVVLCEFAQRFFYSGFLFYERGLLSCYTYIVCIYEATCSVVERLSLV